MTCRSDTSGFMVWIGHSNRLSSSVNRASDSSLRWRRAGVFQLAFVFLVLNLFVVWFLPILPCQDLPQHLAYSRILLDYQNASLPFHDFYQLRDHLFHPYSSTYWALSGLGRCFGIM